MAYSSPPLPPKNMVAESIEREESESVPDGLEVHTSKYRFNGVTPESRAGLRRHLTFANTYRHYLRMCQEVPTDEMVKDKPLIHKLVVHSLRVAFGDNEDARHERRMILERVEGRPTEHKQVGITLKELAESPLAKSLRMSINAKLTPKKSKQLMIEPGPNLEAPHEGALFETIEPSDPRWESIPADTRLSLADPRDPVRNPL